MTGRQLGLDALRIDRGDVVVDEFREDPSALLQDTDDPVTRLTLSKRLRDNIEFTLSQNLRENGKTTYVVSYFPLPNLELRAISRDDSTLGLGLRHQVTLGAGRTKGNAVERPVQRVTGIRFVGDPAPFTEAELRQKVRVKVDEAFEYLHLAEGPRRPHQDVRGSRLLRGAGPRRGVTKPSRASWTWRSW